MKFVNFKFSLKKGYKTAITHYKSVNLAFLSTYIAPIAFWWKNYMTSDGIIFISAKVSLSYDHMLCKVVQKVQTNKPAKQVNNRITRTISGVFIVNFEHIPHLVLVFLLLNLSR